MAGGSGPTAPAAARLLGLRGPQLTRLGIVVLAVGFVLFLGSFGSLFFAGSDFMQDPFGSFGSIMRSFSSPSSAAPAAFS